MLVKCIACGTTHDHRAGHDCRPKLAAETVERRAAPVKPSPSRAVPNVPNKPVPNTVASVPNRTAAERVKAWRSTHAEQHKAYMRDYMAKRRSDAPVTQPTAKP